MQFAHRLHHLQSNVFADMDHAKALAKASGKEIIDLSLGSSDLPAPPHVVETIQSFLNEPTTHGYLLYQGTQNFRKVAANWYSSRFGISVDPETEVLPLIGCQEGTAHLPLALLNPGDFALLQDPGYPSHYGGVYLAGGQVYRMPLLAENGFLPIFDHIPSTVLEQAKLMVLSYPHNPTTAIAPLSFFEEAVEFCRKYNLALVHDFPYLDIVFNPAFKAPSILQADREKALSIEFFTFSKSYNMGGFRIGFAIGNHQLIMALRKIKSVIDFNQYRGILQGAIAALEGSQNCVQETVNIYQQRRDVFVKTLQGLGWEINLPQATMYVWAKLPSPWEHKSEEFCKQLVLKTGVAAAPGAGFGKYGEGYIRLALVKDKDILIEVATKIGEFIQKN